LSFLTGDITTFSSGSHQPQSTYASGGGDRGDRGAMSTGIARRGRAVDLASPGERGWKDGTRARSPFLIMASAARLRFLPARAIAVICPQGGPHEWECVSMIGTAACAC
jgi:hypothetical protein